MEKLNFNFNSNNNINFNVNETETIEILDLLNENNRTSEFKITFELFDKYQDGFINIEDLGNILKSLGHEPTDTELEDLMNDACKPNLEHKKINFEQFMQLMNKRGKEVDLLEEYTEAFRVFDREGNGIIKKEEVRQILNVLGEGISPEEVDTMLRDADVNDDGFIEYKKFVKMLLFK